MMYKEEVYKIKHQVILKIQRLQKLDKIKNLQNEILTKLVLFLIDMPLHYQVNRRVE